MKKTLITLSVIGLFACPTFAQPTSVDAPPAMSQGSSSVADQGRASTGYERMQQKAKSYQSPNPNLAPTAEDYAKARKARKEGRAQRPQSNETEIQTVRDQDNRVTEYIVTPGTTHIPYSVENKSDRQSPANAGQRQGTLGTPKFIQFGF